MVVYLHIFCPSKLKVKFFGVFVSLPDLHNYFSKLGAKTMQIAFFFFILLHFSNKNFNVFLSYYLKGF